MRALLASAVFCSLAVSGFAQNSEIDLSTFIKSTGQTGTVVQDPNAPVSFQLPSGWTLKNGIRWGNHETTLWFVEDSSGVMAAFYYQYPRQTTSPSDPYEFLFQGMNDKVRDRLQMFPDYHLRSGSIQKANVGGQSALSFIAEYTAQGQLKAEYMLRVVSSSTKGHFFVIDQPATDIDAFIARLDSISATLRVP